MKRRFNEKLAQADASGVWAFTLPSFSALMGGVDPAYLKLMMKRLSDQGVLIRAARGIYVNPYARSRPADIRRGLLRFLRPREINYVSLESRAFGGRGHLTDCDGADLHHHRLAGTVRDPWGAVDFTHTDRTIEVGTDVIVHDDGTLEATIRTAVRDLRRVGRNLGLIDEEILADAMSEEESSR